MKKSKWDIIGKDIDRVNDEEYDDWFNYWYDGQDYFYYDYDDGLYDYEYLDSVYQHYIIKKGFRVSFDRINIGSYIDMMSIYSKDVLRQMKINYLLGDKFNIKKPIYADIIKKNNENED